MSGPGRLTDDDFDVLFVGSWARSLALAAFLLGDRTAAEDVVQEAFTALYQRWHAMRDLAGAAGYLRVCVVNGSRSVLRRRRVAKVARPWAPARVAPPADVALLVAEEHGDVVRAVFGLPRRQREVLVLRYWMDLSEADIAACLGISRGSVKSAASRGVAALREVRSDDHGI